MVTSDTYTALLVDDETWAIRYIVVDTSNWWLGHQVLIAPLWINEVRWSDERVSIDLTRQSVKDAPPVRFCSATQSRAGSEYLQTLRAIPVIGQTKRNLMRSRL